jgi:hypothetical protein
MSYILFASSGGGGGVQNPMAVDLDANAFSILNVKDLVSTRRIDAQIMVGSQSVGGATVNAATELAHSDPLGTVGFYGVPPTPQLSVPFPIVGGDVFQNEATINDICTVLQALGLIQ